MNVTENYIGYDALVSYLESKNPSYHGFLNLNQDIIISSLNSLTNSSLTLDKWQSFDITWYKHYLYVAKLLEPDIFVTIENKIKTEHLQRIKELQIYWQEIIKECDPALPKKKQDIKESDKNLTLAEISQPDTSLPKKTSKDSIKNLSKTLQSDLQEVIKENSVKNKVIKNPMDLFTINLKLKNNQYTSLEEFEKDICLIFCNCYTYNDVESEVYSSGKALECIFNKKWNEKLILQGNKQTRELKRVRDNDTEDTDRSWKKQIQILEQNKNNLMYRQVVDNALLIASAYENLVIGIGIDYHY
ncbi:unnamed protein product [Rhizophagus irregularis]|uniref:Bromo domain-containing protein n=1 Tax=Rhizophagus irregularis TaxID=588596 RepID=A0A915ZPN8_9GLOM|nr:unnamed protein product [Rhizophagus irregularis]